MQLRFGSPNRAAQHPGYFFVFVSFNIVQGKDHLVAGRQLNDGLVERYAIHDRHRIGILRALDYLDRRFTIVRSLFHLDAAFAKMHQDLVDGQPVQPGGKSRLTTKATNFSKELDEDFLRKVFGLRDVTGHSQTERINSAIMPLVKLLEGPHVALSRFLSQRVICFLLRLDFGCGHVFVLAQATKSIPSFSACSPRASRVRFFQKSPTTFLGISPRALRVTSWPQRGCVMQRFERVVALPDPKDIEFPLPHQHLERGPQVQ